MREKGVFAALVLLTSILLIFSIKTEELETGNENAIILNEINSIHSATLKRTETENFIDKKITQVILNSKKPLEAWQIKSEINKEILRSLKTLFLKPQECKRVGKHYVQTLQEIGEKEISEISNVIVVKIHSATIVEYSISGAIKRNRTLCAQIKKGNYKTQFVLPVGYRTREIII